MLVLVVALQEVLALLLASTSVLRQVDLHEAKLWERREGVRVSVCVWNEC